jgi:hypothetical protein
MKLSNSLAPPATGTYEPTSGIYGDSGYQEQGQYGQPQVPTTTASTSQTTSRREREGESERDGRHHRSSRR